MNVKLLQEEYVIDIKEKSSAFLYVTKVTYMFDNNRGYQLMMDGSTVISHSELIYNYDCKYAIVETFVNRVDLESPEERAELDYILRVIKHSDYSIPDPHVKYFTL